MSDINWNNNSIQFPRLLAEIYASSSTIDWEGLAASMDLSVEEVAEIFERAQEEWERINSLPPRKP